MFAIRLPEEIESRLEALAKKTGRTKTYHARQAILEYMDDLEDYYLTSSRMLDIEKGHEKTIPLEEAMREYGMED
jgi:RHH-type rel operon transcriptional repressor/antitoxin RelB